MSSLSSFLLLALACFWPVVSGKVYSTKIKKSKGDFSYVQVKLGDSKKYNLLLDTTNTYSVALSSNAIDGNHQNSYDCSDSDTCTSTADTFSYRYTNVTLNGTVVEETIKIGSNDIGTQKLGVGDRNGRLFEDQKLDGALSLGVSSPVMGTLGQITIREDQGTLYMGEYSTKTKNRTNVTRVTDPASLGSSMWVFDYVSFGIDGVTQFKDGYAVVDAGSPYLTFALSRGDFKAYILDNIGECKQNYKCKNLRKFVTLQVGNSSFVVGKGSFYKHNRLLLRRRDPIDGVSGTVIFLGRPFLENVITTMNLGGDWIELSFKKHTSADNWELVWIVLVVVASVAALFFGFFWYKHRIPPAQRNTPDIEQRQRLMGDVQPPGRSQPMPLGMEPQQPSVNEQPSVPQPSGAQQLGGSDRPLTAEELRQRRLRNINLSGEISGDIPPPSQ